MFRAGHDEVAAIRHRRGLSSREMAVLAGASRGLTTKELAVELGISNRTVSFHLANIYRKLGTHSRVEAANAYRNLVAGHPPGDLIPVLDLATRLAARVCAPTLDVRATYFGISRGMVQPLVEVDDSGMHLGRAFPLAEHPFMSALVSRNQPQIGPLQSVGLGPTVSRLATAVGVTAGGGVPVAPRGAVHRVLSIAVRGADVPPESFELLVDVGRILEYALADAV